MVFGLVSCDRVWGLFLPFGLFSVEREGGGNAVSYQTTLRSPLGESFGFSTESARCRGHPGAPALTMQCAQSWTSLPPSHVVYAGTPRRRALRFCDTAGLAGK